MALSRRTREVPPPVVVPPDGKRLVAEADRANYAALGWTSAGSGSLYLGPEIASGLVPVVVDALSDRRRPERGGIVCGVHDEQVERRFAQATEARYTRAVLTVRVSPIPPLGAVSDREDAELRGVLLFSDGAAERERRRAARVVELARGVLAAVPTAEAARDLLVERALQPYGVLRWELGKAVVAAGLRGREADRAALLDELTALDPGPAARLR